MLMNKAQTFSISPLVKIFFTFATNSKSHVLLEQALRQNPQQVAVTGERPLSEHSHCALKKKDSHVEIGTFMLAIPLKLQYVWCELEFKNEFKHRSPRDRQANEKTRGLYCNNNQHLGRNVRSVQYTIACVVCRKVFSIISFLLQVENQRS